MISACPLGPSTLRTAAGLQAIGVHGSQQLFAGVVVAERGDDRGGGAGARRGDRLVEALAASM